MNTDAPLPRFRAPAYVDPMQAAIRQWRVEEQQLIARLSPYQWGGESVYGPIIARVMADGAGMVMLDTDRDGVYETQAIAAVGGSIAATPDMRGAPDNIRVTPGAEANAFAYDVRHSLSDERFTGDEMDRLALRALRASGRPIPATSTGPAR